MKSKEGYEMAGHWIGTKLYFHKELRSSAKIFHSLMAIDRIVYYRH